MLLINVACCLRLVSLYFVEPLDLSLLLYKELVSKHASVVRLVESTFT